MDKFNIIIIFFLFFLRICDIKDFEKLNVKTHNYKNNILFLWNVRLPVRAKCIIVRQSQTSHLYAVCAQKNRESFYSKPLVLVSVSSVNLLGSPTRLLCQRTLTQKLYFFVQNICFFLHYFLITILGKHSFAKFRSHPFFKWCYISNQVLIFSSLFPFFLLHLFDS